MDLQSTTAEPKPALRIDEQALSAYLEAQLEGFQGPLTVRAFKGGRSNPTYLLSTPERRYVLRKKPPGKLLPSAHNVAREFRIMRALAATEVPVPEMLVLCEDPEVIGTDFFVMEHVDGRVLENPHYPELSPSERNAAYRDLARVLGALHSVDVDATGLSDLGKRGNYFERQISRWTKQYAAARTHDIGAMDALIGWLPDNIPATEEVAFVHGDYQPANSIMHPTQPRLIALIDWELSTLGHPLADLAYQCNMTYHFPGLFGDQLEPGPQTGLPTEDEYVQMYCEATGRDGIDGWNFFRAFSCFRSASICQGVYKRGLDGNASGSDGENMLMFTRAAADVGFGFIK